MRRRVAGVREEPGEVRFASRVGIGAGRGRAALRALSTAMAADVMVMPSAWIKISE